MPSFCAVSNCELKYSHSENVSFHKFPLNSPKILVEWIKFTNRGANWKPSRWNSICSRHFDKSDFREYLSRKCLKKEAIPTIVTKNSISYETYHITSNSPDNTRTGQLESDDYGAPIESFYDSKTSSEIGIGELCRLCGERAENLTCNPLRTLDDAEIVLMCRKCLPSFNVHNFQDLSRVVCTDCVTNLKQYSDYIDKVMLYQRDLGAGENVDSYANSENSLTSGNRNFGVKPSTPALFIKQEPINVKQEKIDNSNRRPFTTQIPTMSPSMCPNPFAEAKKNKGIIHQEVNIPKTEVNSTFCDECDRIFLNCNEYRTHECSNTERNRDQGNNCEIMEIITLNNPVSFIDLAEDENITNIELRKPKPEILGEFEDRERLAYEHAYAKRTTNTSCNLKQEIIDSYNDTSQNGYDDHFNEQDEHTFNQAYFDETAQFFDCTKCGQIFISQELLDDHITQSHPLKQKICSICHAVFKTSYEFLVHKSKFHTQRYQCKQCRQRFQTQAALKNHKQYCKHESKDFCYSCRHCGKNQRNLAVMRKHLGYCTGKLSQDESQPAALKVSQSTQQEPVQKLDFTQNILRQNNMNQSHIDQQESNQNPSTDRLYVESDLNVSRLMNVGDSDSGTKQSFKFIVDDSKFIFLNENKMMPANDVGMNGKFACDTCGLPFESFIQLKQHKLEHDSERKFNCSLCPKTFKGISGLKQHISGFHYKIKPYSCPVCNYAYALKGDMQRCRHSKLKNQSSFKIV